MVAERERQVDGAAGASSVAAKAARRRIRSSSGEPGSVVYENILQVCSVTPQVNQLLVHAGNTPAELIAYCESRNILVEAYSPIAHAQT